MELRTPFSPNNAFDAGVAHQVDPVVALRHE
jgi:hypothetical protein